MYEAHFGLMVKPFSLSPDPEFLYLGKRHKQAYSILKFGITEQVGFAVITGEVGSGKTTVLRKVIDELDDAVNIAIVAHTHQGMEQIMPVVLDAFGAPLDTLPENETLYYRVFSDFLVEQYNNGRRSLLIIDEAQNLTAKALEQLRLLSNVNVDGHLLLQTILIGQPELRECLQLPELRQFAQRISVDFFLPRLTMKESIEYIDHRLSIAGGGVRIFDDTSKKLIAYMARGLPRLINNLAEMALVYAFAEQQKVVSKQVVLDVIKDKQRSGVLPIKPLESLATYKREKPKTVQALRA